MKPVDDGYEVFRVEWMQDARLAAAGTPASPASTALASQSPRIGPAHEASYTQ